MSLSFLCVDILRDLRLSANGASSKASVHTIVNAARKSACATTISAKTKWRWATLVKGLECDRYYDVW
jgi:hypothetical protein